MPEVVIAHYNPAQQVKINTNGEIVTANAQAGLHVVSTITGAGGSSPLYTYNFSKSLSKLEAWETYRIDALKLKPCMQTILADLKNISKGVGTVVQKFAGNTPGFNWKVQDGSLNGATAGTSTSYNTSTGTVTTTFDSQAWKSATDLSWARTILHEAVHAYVITAKYTTTSSADRIKLLGPDWAVAFMYPSHEYMANNYVKPIADGLQEYGIMQGYNHSRQFYEDMAWGGLLKTTTFNGLPSADKTRIPNTINVELRGRDTSGKTQTQKGKNAGC